jgi:hypothetical protein
MKYIKPAILKTVDASSTIQGIGKMPGTFDNNNDQPLVSPAAYEADE